MTNGTDSQILIENLKNFDRKLYEELTLPPSATSPTQGFTVAYENWSQPRKVTALKKAAAMEPMKPISKNISLANMSFLRSEYYPRGMVDSLVNKGISPDEIQFVAETVRGQNLSKFRKCKDQGEIQKLFLELFVNAMNIYIKERNTFAKSGPKELTSKRKEMKIPDPYKDDDPGRGPATGSMWPNIPDVEVEKKRRIFEKEKGERLYRWKVEQQPEKYDVNNSTMADFKDLIEICFNAGYGMMDVDIIKDTVSSKFIIKDLEHHRKLFIIEADKHFRKLVYERTGATVTTSIFDPKPKTESEFALSDQEEKDAPASPPVDASEFDLGEL